MVLQNGFRVELFNPDTGTAHKEFTKGGETYIEAYPDGQYLIDITVMDPSIYPGVSMLYPHVIVDGEDLGYNFGMFKLNRRKPTGRNLEQRRRHRLIPLFCSTKSSQFFQHDYERKQSQRFVFHFGSSNNLYPRTVAPSRSAGSCLYYLVRTRGSEIRRHVPAA